VLIATLRLDEGCGVGATWTQAAAGGRCGWVRPSERAGICRTLERHRIATLRGPGLGVREIARRLGRSRSAVSRELRRNLRPHDAGLDDGDLAHARARERARRNRAGRLANAEQLRGVVQDKLELEWSPEEISAWLRLNYPDRSSWHVCHETIYQAIYHGRKGGLSRQLTKRLRTGRPLRKRRRRADQRTPQIRGAPSSSIADPRWSRPVWAEK
jgi:IS30 family transposase